MSKYEYIIISDLHLGSNVCCSKELIKFLQDIYDRKIETHELILNGDVFDNWDINRLNKEHWEILSLFRLLSKRIKLTWIIGNHDDFIEVVSHIVGACTIDEYIVSNRNKKFLVLHGHQFDEFLVKHPIITYIGDLVYKSLQKLDKSFYLARMVKSGSKTYLRCSQKVSKKAKEHMTERKCDIVCCGHTHRSEDQYPYYNTGSWSELPCTYVTIKDGKIELKTWSN